MLETGHAGPPQGAALRRLAFNLLLFGCRQSGAAFIKWGQWASSRPDLLPEVLSRRLRKELAVVFAQVAVMFKRFSCS